MFRQISVTHSLSTEHSALSTTSDLRLVIVGHVDHGKSTLVGRLLHETDSLPEGKFEQIKASCDKRGMAFEWAFLMDALQAERDQNVTIDMTQIWFSTALRRYCLIDAPGHREFVKNMMTGAASADAALVLIDAEEGLRAQSRRHAYLLSLLGVPNVIVVVNKMDAVGYDKVRFETLCNDFTAYLSELGLTAHAYVPISAREGEGLTQLSDHMPWYQGPTLMAAMDGLEACTPDETLTLRFAVQDVYRFDERRIIVGRIESGQMQLGDTLLFSPSNESATIKSFESWPEVKRITSAQAGQSVAITLDEQIFVERGQLASHSDHPPTLSNLMRVRLFWLHDTPLTIGVRYRVKLASAMYYAEVKSIETVIDPDVIEQAQPLDAVHKLQVGEVTFRLRAMAAYDDHQRLPRTGRMVLYDGYDVAGGGVLSADNVPDFRHKAAQVKSQHITAVDFAIDADERAAQNGHKAGVLWFTGLSGSGKSTLAKELQKRLFAKGCQVYVLDGDNIRHGLCSDLGFSAEDRAENIRRVGEVAGLFADAGCIVIAAFISPYIEDRRRAQANAIDRFHTIYIKADVDTCERRDVKGLYAKAKAGEIQDFTGISAPYEEPEFPDLVVDTAEQSVEESVDMLMTYVQRELMGYSSIASSP